MDFIRKKLIALGVLFLLAILLTACGGGGGSGTTTGSTTCAWDNSTWDNCKLE